MNAPDPLGWPGYREQVARARERTGGVESVSWRRTRRAVEVVFDFRFLGGSVGTATGDVVEEAFGQARAARLPVVSRIATGGSRMQEGMLSLRQLQRVAALCARHRAAGLPHVSVLGDPTTGGLWASLGAGADYVIAVAGAQVGFAGSRVRPADDPAYTAEGQFAAGAVDLVAEPGDVDALVAAVLELLTRGDAVPAEVPRALGAEDLPADGWDAVLRARAPERPRAARYLDDYFDLRVPVNGDRAGGVDPGVLCGIGLRGERPVAFAAQTGTATTPAGFRTASRLIRLAERFALPVLTLVDTPGAANDPAAERAGVGPAIAELFTVVAGSRVPITTLVIGEGGSGGALALASPEHTWITPDAYFSVIAPELAANILKRDDVPALADDLRLRPQDLVELGVVRGIASHG
ncbi:carboxyl transferase domain-containing protein [Saccharothrix longispora]|uniref:carboxyl transferase domain-containing protein n=1 Tax=Saccharothrix longispora TaxID=33920 RepID=UPI0028FD1247|nr:carboxyl transferase domain-containing protein [Saccharothrix longispora]MBY8848303.1 acetyl-CoA carboxylase [Saccharothrix sp. MB29]MDU0292242.1 carboxyl transferase domain-containing protein [Saccharothrix longispora]